MSEVPHLDIAKIEIQNSDRTKKQLDLNFLLGAEHYIDSMQTLEWNLNYSSSNQENIREILYDDFDQALNLTNQSNRTENEDEDQFRIESNFNYVLKFRKKSHKLNISALNSYATEKERSSIPEFLTFTTDSTPLGLQNNTRTGNDQTQKTFVGQVDYTLPINKMKIELGAKYNFRDNFNDIFVEQQNIATSAFLRNDLFTGVTNYTEKISAIYAQFNNKYENWT